MRKFITTLALIVLGTISLLKCSGNGHLFKALSATYFDGKKGPTINDLPVFDYRRVNSENHNFIAKGIGYGYYMIDSSLWREIESYDPVGFLVLHRDRIVIEQYYNDYNDASLVNSFSVAKSIVALAVLKAIELGHIESVDQNVIDFIPELDGDYNEVVTIRHLLAMTSGIDFNESYGNPFGFMAAAYYGDDLEDLALSYDADIEPGSEWKYLGGNTILLSIIVSRATGEPLSDFVSKHIWTKIGAPVDAYWSLDEEDGLEKAYCCFYTSLRDYSRFGMLVKNNGMIFKKGALSSELLAELKKPVVLNNGEVIEYYGWHWWRLEYDDAIVTYARGIQGQYIITIPEYDIVIVRLGTRRGITNSFNHPEDLYLYVELAKSIHEQTLLP